MQNTFKQEENIDTLLVGDNVIKEEERIISEPMDVDELKEKANIDEIINEIKVVSKITHERVPKFYGVWQCEKYFCLIFRFLLILLEGVVVIGLGVGVGVGYDHTLNVMVARYPFLRGVRACGISV